MQVLPSQFAPVLGKVATPDQTAALKKSTAASQPISPASRWSDKLWTFDYPISDNPNTMKPINDAPSKQAQREANVPAYWLEIGEGHPADHSNILFTLGGPKTPKLISRLRASPQFPGDLLVVKKAESAQWFVAYCSKELTPQAKFIAGTRLSRRRKGSHPLGEGGGDRLRMSKELKRDVLAAGCIPPWRRVYASRALPK